MRVNERKDTNVTTDEKEMMDNNSIPRAQDTISQLKHFCGYSKE